MLNQKRLNFLAEWKEVLISSCVAVFCLALFYLFPAKGLAQAVSSAVFFLLVVPVLYIKLILKKNLADFGASLPLTRNGLLTVFIALIISLLMSYFFIHFTPFRKFYSVPVYAMSGFWNFLLYEFVFFNYLFFLLEFFFKGFFLFIFSEKIGYLSIPLTVLVSFVFLYLAKTFSWDNALYMITMLTGAFVAFRTRSFFLSYLMGILFIIMTDAYLIYLFKNSL